MESAKRKGRRYDALVGISGGKDSSYCLYLCHKVYGLKVLTFTRDNGFLAAEGKQRLEHLVQIFGVPHLYYEEPITQELASVFMRKTGNFCAPCELLTFNLSASIAAKYDIPLIILGSSTRTEAPPPKHLNPWDPWYFGKVMKGEPYHEQIHHSSYGRNYVVRQGLAQLLGRRRLVILPDYLEWDNDKISQLFMKEFGIRFGEEHSDCWAYRIASYMYTKKCGGIHPRVAKYSLLVRTGKMTREEALKQLGTAENVLPAADLDRFLEVIRMTRQEFDAAVERTPAPYLTGLPQLFNALRRRVRRQAA
jgi:hypothetical protein